MSARRWNPHRDQNKQERRPRAQPAKHPILFFFFLHQSDILRTEKNDVIAKLHLPLAARITASALKFIDVIWKVHQLGTPNVDFLMKVRLETCLVWQKESILPRQDTYLPFPHLAHDWHSSSSAAFGRFNSAGSDTFSVSLKPPVPKVKLHFSAGSPHLVLKKKRKETMRGYTWRRMRTRAGVDKKDFGFTWEKGKR